MFYATADEMMVRKNVCKGKDIKVEWNQVAPMESHTQHLPWPSRKYFGWRAPFVFIFISIQTNGRLTTQQWPTTISYKKNKWQLKTFDKTIDEDRVKAYFGNMFLYQYWWNDLLDSFHDSTICSHLMIVNLHYFSLKRLRLQWNWNWLLGAID